VAPPVICASIVRALACGRRPGTSGLPCSSAAGQRQLTKRMTAGSKYSTWPSPSVHRFQIDGGLLLLDQASNCLFAYNDTARHVWDLIREGRTEESVISEFARAWEISLSGTRGCQRDHCRVAATEHSGRSPPRQNPPRIGKAAIHDRYLERIARGRVVV
jgi:hypothetical protein